MDGKDCQITVEQLCEMVDLLYPCMDDFLYVYDLKKITILFRLTQKRDSVCRIMNFMMWRKIMKSSFILMIWTCW